MPKSTIAVSLIAVFLLGYLIGTSHGEKSAAAGPTVIDKIDSHDLATGEWSDSATLWTVSGGRVSKADRYSRGGAARADGAEALNVAYLVPPEEPAATKVPPK